MPNPMTRTPAAVITSLKELGEKLGREPVTADLPAWLKSATRKRFGSIGAAKEAAGFQRRQYYSGPLKWTPEVIESSLWDIYRELGRSPTQIEIPSDLLCAIRQDGTTFNEYKRSIGMETYPQYGPRDGGWSPGYLRITDRVFAYLNENGPSSWADIKHDMGITHADLSILGNEYLKDHGLRVAGPKYRYLYYLEGQEHMLPENYQRYKIGQCNLATITDSIRDYVDGHPSFWGEIKAGLGLNAMQANSIYNVWHDDPNFQAIGPSRRRLYYIAGQEKQLWERIMDIEYPLHETLVLEFNRTFADL